MDEAKVHRVLLTMLKSKLHWATATAVNLDYEGSIAIDTELLAVSGILEHERVEVYDLDNGARFATYVISADRGSGVIGINGAAAHLVNKGDRLIITAYCQLAQEEARRHVPVVVVLSKDNTVSSRTGAD